MQTPGPCHRDDNKLLTHLVISPISTGHQRNDCTEWSDGVRSLDAVWRVATGVCLNVNDVTVGNRKHWPVCINSSSRQPGWWKPVHSSLARGR